MNTFNILLTTLIICSIALCIAIPSTEIEEKVSNVKIIDGIEVTPHSMPYMVAIKSVINYTDVLCGGSLISTSFVLTAATCVNGASEAKVILGAHDIEKSDEEGQQTAEVQEFIIHENFNPKTVENDIALIMLKEPVTLSATISTIKLPDVADVFNRYEETSATVAGWGRTSDTSQNTSNVLRAQNLTVIPLLMCDISYLFRLKFSQMCTSGVSRKNICKGDAGSPLVLNGVQIGIASYGSAFGCSLGLPSVYTRVTSFLNWLLLSSS